MNAATTIVVLILLVSITAAPCTKGPKPGYNCQNTPDGVFFPHPDDCTFVVVCIKLQEVTVSLCEDGRYFTLIDPDRALGCPEKCKDRETTTEDYVDTSIEPESTDYTSAETFPTEPEGTNPLSSEPTEIEPDITEYSTVESEISEILSTETGISEYPTIETEPPEYTDIDIIDNTEYPTTDPDVSEPSLETENPDYFVIEPEIPEYTSEEIFTVEFPTTEPGEIDYTDTESGITDELSTEIETTEFPTSLSETSEHLGTETETSDVTSLEPLSTQPSIILTSSKRPPVKPPTKRPPVKPLPKPTKPMYPTCAHGEIFEHPTDCLQAYVCTSSGEEPLVISVCEVNFGTQTRFGCPERCPFRG